MNKEEVLEIAKGVRPDLDWEKEKTLMDDGKLDSFDVVAIASDLMEKYDIEMTADDIGPENFNSIDLICDLVERKLEED